MAIISSPDLYGNFSIDFTDSFSDSGNYEINQPLMDNLNKLSRFGKYEKDWNGYGAEPFSASLIMSVKKLLMSMNVQPQIFPAADHSIQLEYDGEEGEYLEFQVFENGTVHYYSIDKNGNEKEKEMICSAEEMNHLIEDFYGSSFR
ncbi:MAG: hypothetical protein IKD68_05110 [Solobacterium sp.]|nr:hypothetical protein [Solobacterium sp.]